MATPAALDLRLVSVVELGAQTIQLSVRECWTERRWWWLTVEREHVKFYTLHVHAGHWFDADRRVTDTALSLRLFELLLASRSEQSLDAYVGIDAPVHVLPPVPVMPPR